MEGLEIPVTPVLEDRPAVEENVGRWSDQEHNLFLEGLQTYGKQWKTISNLIGTRTVVQVRTHAQKYFQKLERKNNKIKTPPSETIPHQKPSKRKSMPASLPSRKKTRNVPATTNSVHRTPSLSLVSVNDDQLQLDLLPIYMSTSSLSTGNWSTSSPTGVNEIDLQCSVSEDSQDMFADEVTLGAPTEGELLEDTADDPLDWLIDRGIGHLPESSLEPPPPIFPDLSNFHSDKIGEDEIQSTSGESSNKAFDASLLKDMADPTVSVQSLFLDDADAQLV